MAFRQAFKQHWWAVEAIPIYGIIGSVIAGGAWYLHRLAMGPTIQWTKANPQPWNSIKPDQGTKIMEVSHKTSSTWKRDKL